MQRVSRMGFFTPVGWQGDLVEFEGARRTLDITGLKTSHRHPVEADAICGGVSVL